MGNLTDLLEIEQTANETYLILLYQLGDVARHMIYEKRFADEDNPYSFRGELRSSLADSLVMLQLLAEQLGFDKEELENYGYERYRERLLELSENNK